MTYTPKFQPCPYKTNTGKCTHKRVGQKVSKRKHLCGYKKVENCPYYNNWLNTKKIDSEAPEGLYELSQELSNGV